MKAIQKWFDQLAGISEYNFEREARMTEFFRTAPFDTSGLETPACWRRNGGKSQHRCTPENRRNVEHKDHKVG